MLNYFEIIEDLKIDKDQRDLLLLKKALYLKKYSSSEESEKLLKETNRHRYKTERNC